ncbi:MAG: hypothetical protein AB7F86_16460 [Bdellovibrionales bacterium]
MKYSSLAILILVGSLANAGDLSRFNSEYQVVQAEGAIVDEAHYRSCSYKTSDDHIVRLGCSKNLVGIGNALLLDIFDKDGRPLTPSGTSIAVGMVRHQVARKYWIGPNCSALDFCEMLNRELQRKPFHLSTQFSESGKWFKVPRVDLDLDI